MDQKVILDVKNLSKNYAKSKNGINNVSFQINENEIHAFIGENGAGKSTTIKCIIDSYTNFSGKILINNFPSNTPDAKHFLGYVPENAIFPREFSCFELLHEFGLLSETNSESVIKKINYYLNLFKINHLRDLKPDHFSSGEKRKIMLVQSLLHDPKLIILDEPFSNLDPTAREEFIYIIKKLKDEGKTVFLTTNYLAAIEKITDSLTLIHKGKIVFSGQKTENLLSIYKKLVIKANK